MRDTQIIRGGRRIIWDPARGCGVGVHDQTVVGAGLVPAHGVVARDVVPRDDAWVDPIPVHHGLREADRFHPTPREPNAGLGVTVAGDDDGVSRDDGVVARDDGPVVGAGLVPAHGVVVRDVVPGAGRATTRVAPTAWVDPIVAHRGFRITDRFHPTAPKPNAGVLFQ
jgi:hypothetical protein